MPKTIGGSRVPRTLHDFDPKGAGVSGATNLGSLREISSTTERQDVQAAVSRFETIFGLSTRDIKIGDNMPDGALAYAESVSGRVVIDRASLSQGRMNARMQKLQKDGWLVPATRQTGALVVHELSHTMWNTTKTNLRIAGLNGKQLAATKKMNGEIADLYMKFRKDWIAGKKPLSKYATANMNEFWAEGITAGAVGTPKARKNRYASGLVKIAKKYGIRDGAATKF